jgi:hypothetical protein
MATSKWDQEDYGALARALDLLSEGHSQFQDLVDLTDRHELLNTIGGLSHKELRQIVMERVVTEQLRDRPALGAGS